MLAYSTISHMGFLLIGILSGGLNGYASGMFYVVVYVLMSLGAFGMILLLSREGFEAENLDDFKGLNQRSPWHAFLMLLLMFSMAGVPPTVGFYAKFAVLQAIVEAGHIWLAVIAVIFSLIGAFYYLRIVKLMYFDDPVDQAPIAPRADVQVLLSVNGLAVLAFGHLPAAADGAVREFHTGIVVTVAQPPPSSPSTASAAAPTGADMSEQALSSETVFHGKLLHVKRDRVRLPNGHESVREYIVHPGASMIIAMLDADTIVLERQYRYPVNRHFIELPAGKIDPGEAPLAAAQRELREECGYTAREWRHLTTMHPAIGYADEHIELYLARGLADVGHQRDDDELIEVLHVPVRQAMDWIREGIITEAKAVTGVLWAEKIVNGVW